MMCTGYWRRLHSYAINCRLPDNSLEPTALAGSLVSGSTVKIAFHCGQAYSASTVRHLNSGVMHISPWRVCLMIVRV
jgi:hypothetical protein